MSEQKSLLLEIAEAVDRRLQKRASQSQGELPKKRDLPWLHRLGKQLTPNLGSVLLVLILLWVFPGLAAPNQSPAAASISTIPYQGRLADSGGTPVTAMQNMEFRIYDVPTGGTPLWEELWTGGNSVSVSDGLFSVLLGSLNTGLTTVVQGYDELYLGVTVGTDSEMSPRVQLGSVPFSMQALTVPDGSVTTAKIADEAVTQAKLSPDINISPVRLQVSSDQSTSLTTTETWTVLDGMMITDTFKSGTAVVRFSAPMRLLSANSTGLSRIVVDGISQTLTGFSASGNFVGWHDEVISLQTVIDLTEGSHTIAVEWWTNSTQLTQEDGHRVLIVEQ